VAEVVALVTSRRGQVVLADLAVVVAAALVAVVPEGAGNAYNQWLMAKNCSSLITCHSKKQTLGQRMKSIATAQLAPYRAWV